MESVSVSEASRRLHRLIELVGATNDPLLIAGPRSECVLVPVKLWNGIHETLYLHSVPGLKEALLEGIETPLGDSAEEPPW